MGAGDVSSDQHVLGVRARSVATGHVRLAVVERFVGALPRGLIDQRRSRTLDIYEESLAEAQQIIGVEDIPVIAIAQPKWPTVLNKSVQGFSFNPINLGTYDLHKLSKS
jgi:hypothetical protein